MSQIRIDKASMVDNTVTKISKNTGISSFSKGSRIPMIVEAMADDISVFTEEVANASARTNVLGANGKYLDAKGADFNTYRKRSISFNVSRSDQMISIVPEGEDFSGATDVASIIPSGTTVKLGGNFSFFISEDVQVNPYDSKIFVSGEVRPSTNSDSVNIPEGSKFKFDTGYSGVLANAHLLNLVFDKPISMVVENETDEDYRSRIKDSQNMYNSSSDPAITKLIKEVPGVKDFITEYNYRSSSSLDVFFVTEIMSSGGTDPNSYGISNAISQYVSDSMVRNVKVSCTVPSPMSLTVSIGFSSEQDVSIDYVSRISSVAFSKVYKYSDRGIDLNSLASEIEKSSVLSNVVISSAEIFSDKFGENISVSGGRVDIPPEFYLLFNSQGVTVDG